jgi:hypothetical protein
MKFDCSLRLHNCRGKQRDTVKGRNDEDKDAISGIFGGALHLPVSRAPVTKNVLSYRVSRRAVSSSQRVQVARMPPQAAESRPRCCHSIGYIGLLWRALSALCALAVLWCGSCSLCFCRTCMYSTEAYQARQPPSCMGVMNNQISSIGTEHATCECTRAQKALPMKWTLSNAEDRAQCTTSLNPVFSNEARPGIFPTVCRSTLQN